MDHSKVCAIRIPWTRDSSDRYSRRMKIFSNVGLVKKKRTLMH